MYILLQALIIPDLRFLLMFPATNNSEALFQLPHVPVGDRILVKHHRRYYSVLQGGMDVAPSFPKACDVSLGTAGVSLDLCSPKRKTEFSNSNISRSTLTPTTSYVSRRCMERTSIFRLFRCWLRNFFSFFGTFTPDNEHAGGSAFCLHRDLLPEEALVTHSITCHGRDHLVNIRTERHSLIIVNVHF